MMTSIERLPEGQRGIVRSIAGGRGIMQKLEALGLRPGKIVTKLNCQLMGGPVTVMVDGRELAIGRGMAARVLVEPESDS